MNDLLNVLKTLVGSQIKLVHLDDGRLAIRRIPFNTNVWEEPDLQGIAREISAIVDGFYPEGWSHIIFEYEVHYWHGKGLVWGISNHGLEKENGEPHYNSDLIQAIEDHGKYGYLADALIDTIYRGEDVAP